MLDMNEIRKGKVIIFEDEPYLVTSAQFLRKQQRRPVMKTILKHLRTGKTKEHSYQQADRIEEATIEKRAVQFLYTTDSRYAFMDNETYEQIEFDADTVGAAAHYLTEGQQAHVVSFDGKPVSVEMPVKVDRKVLEAYDAVRGDTSNNVTKEVVIEGGLKIQVPLFIKEGEIIRLDTRTGQYLERA